MGNFDSSFEQVEVRFRPRFFTEALTGPPSEILFVDGKFVNPEVFGESIVPLDQALFDFQEYQLILLRLRSKLHVKT